MDDLYIYAIAAILVSGAATALTRFIPFLLFGGKHRMPESLRRLANVLPSAVIATLVVYGVSDRIVLLDMSSLAALAALAITVCVHLLFKNTLLSMFSGTCAYMIMVSFL